jgi:hypothetical protein
VINPSLDKVVPTGIPMRWEQKKTFLKVAEDLAEFVYQKTEFREGDMVMFWREGSRGRLGKKSAAQSTFWV